MAIVRALDGTFYEVPDDQLSRCKIPEDQLKSKLGETAPTDEGPPPGGGGEGPGSSLVNVHIYYSGQAGGAGGEAVQPYDWHWRRWYRNDWRRRHWD
jgi:hypothetical protein